MGNSPGMGIDVRAAGSERIEREVGEQCSSGVVP